MLHLLGQLDPMVYMLVVVTAVAFGVAALVLLDLFGSPEAEAEEDEAPEIGEATEPVLTEPQEDEVPEIGEATEPVLTGPQDALR